MEFNLVDIMTAIVIAIIGSGALGYWIKYLLDKKQQYSTRNAEFKRAAYADVISLLMAVLSSGKLGQMSDKEMVRKLNSAYSQCILYASPAVILAFGDVMQYMYTVPSEKQTSKRTMRLITKIFESMRVDIGLDNTGLGEDAEKIMRVRLNDYNMYFDE